MANNEIYLKSSSKARFWYTDSGGTERSLLGFPAHNPWPSTVAGELYINKEASASVPRLMWAFSSNEVYQLGLTDVGATTEPVGSLWMEGSGSSTKLYISYNGRKWELGPAVLRTCYKKSVDVAMKHNEYDNGTCAYSGDFVTCGQQVGNIETAIVYGTNCCGDNTLRRNYRCVQKCYSAAGRNVIMLHPNDGTSNCAEQGTVHTCPQGQVAELYGPTCAHCGSNSSLHTQYRCVNDVTVVKQCYRKNHDTELVIVDVMSDGSCVVRGVESRCTGGDGWLLLYGVVGQCGCTPVAYPNWKCDYDEWVEPTTTTKTSSGTTTTRATTTTKRQLVSCAECGGISTEAGYCDGSPGDCVQM